MKETEMIEWLADALQKGEVLMACDGSMKKGRNAYAVCVGDSNIIKKFTFAQEMCGWPVCSDRSELGGILTCIELVEVVAEWKGINPRVKVYCDNQEAVNFVDDPYIGSTPKWADRRNVDLKLQIRNRIKQARVKIEVFHVKSHQDDKTPEKELPREAQMNCICDRRAKLCVESLGRRTEHETQEWAESMVVMVRNRKGYVTRTLGEEIERELYEREVANVIRVREVTMKVIDWEAHERAMQRVKSPEVTRRLLWGDNPTRMKLKQQRKCEDACCPLCGEKDTALHFMVCPRIVRSEEWRDEEIKFQQKAEKQKIPGFLVVTILESLNGVEKASDRQPGHRRNIYRRQAEIGWENFTKGRIHKDWSKYRRENDDGGFMNEEEWNVRLVTEILEMFTEKWKIRCNLMETEGKEKEEKRLRERCKEKRDLVTEGDLLQQDRYLLQERYRPHESIRESTIREWERSLELAIRAKEKVD